MPEAIDKLMQPIKALPPVKRWLLGGVVGLTALAFAALIFVANRVDYRPLFTNLGSDDAGEIVKKLKDQKVPYQISGDGKAILVPSDKVYELRLSLASEGLPQGGGVGFEIFDRKNFGMTEFVQKLNFQRALQGELSRTIAQLAGVEQVRVHLAIPEKSLFKDQEKPPTASIVMKMKEGKTLRENEVQGIVHLVASSVEGLDPDNVSVLDSRGKVLSRNTQTDAAGRMTSAMLETQRTYEKNMEERLQSLLDKVVGNGRSAARVSATFDFRQVEKFEEKYDPESPAVRSEQRSEEKSSMTGVGGVPGAQTNLGRGGGQVPGATTGGAKSDETLNYELSRMTARTVEPVGTLSKVSVALLVDGRYEAPTSGKEGAKAKYVPRNPEELQKIEALVKSAVGFNAERGDQVTVANIPFQEGIEDVEPVAWWERPVFGAALKNLSIVAGFLLLVLFVLRPLMKMLKSTAAPSPAELMNDELELEQKAVAQRARLAISSTSQMELLEMARQKPYQTAQVIQAWLEDKPAR